MSTMVKVNTKVVIDGEIMKSIKNMVKSVKKNREFEVLNYAKFDIDNDVLSVTVSHLEFTLQQSFNVDAEGVGSFLIPFDIIRKVTHIKKDSQYTFQVINDNTVEFNKNGAIQRINTLNVNEYPKQINAKFDYINNVSFDEVLNLNKALISVSKTETRPILTGVLIRDSKIASTDSHRLFMTKSQIKHDEDITITSPGIKKLKDVFNKNDSNIEVYISDEYIKFKTDNKTVIIKQLAGNYPELERLISSHHQTEFVINNVKEFNQIIKDAATITKDVHNNVIEFEISENQLIVTASDPNVGSYKNTININSFVGDDLKISMNGKYLLDGIKQIDGDSLHFKFIGSMRPFMISENGNDNTLSLILPVRTF